jgi:small-conductance mechanosensitive channel
MEEQVTQLLGVKEILLGYANSFLEILPAIVIAIVVLLVFLILSRYVGQLVEKFATRFTDDRSLQSLFGTVTRVVAVVIGVFAAAAVIFPGLNAGTLVSVLGLSSVAVGFAFKDIFENFLAGILILSGRPFAIGDQIETNGYAGTVEHISIRNTLIRTFDGRRVVIPNSKIFQNPMTVNTAYETRRTTFITGVGYDVDIDTARQVILDAVNACECVLREPATQVLLMEHGSSSLNFHVRYWTRPTNNDIRLGQDVVASAIKYALDEHVMDMPYPHQVVQFYDCTDSSEQAEHKREESEPESESAQ